MLAAVIHTLHNEGAYGIELEDRTERHYQGWKRLQINVFEEVQRICDGEPHGTHRDSDNPDDCAVCGEEVEE